MLRALLCGPKILILDEPANRVHSLCEEFIQGALNWLRRHYTMLMIAQRLSTVARAHWIILLTKAGSQSKLPRRNPRRSAAF